MPGIWFALGKSLPCKYQPSDIRDLGSSGTINNVPCKKRFALVSCLANLRDFIHGSKKRNVKPSICGRVVEESRAEQPKTVTTGNETAVGNSKSSFTSCPTVNQSPRFDDHFPLSLARDSNRPSFENSSLCQTCGEQHEHSVSTEEPHHLSTKRVSELVEGDSSRKIVEIICQTGQESSNKSKTIITEEDTKIEKILKVHHTQNILTRFEEYREMVKTNAIKESKRYNVNPRCLADGNELLMFYATTVSCSLVADGSSILCKLSHCGACRILRNGCFTKDFVGRIGIFVSSNSDRALGFVRDQEQKSKMNKALFVCRVIAGKLHTPVRKIGRGFSSGSGFDSLVWKVGRNRIAEELVLLNPRALLPCVVAFYKR